MLRFMLHPWKISFLKSRFLGLRLPRIKFWNKIFFFLPKIYISYFSFFSFHIFPHIPQIPRFSFHKFQSFFEKKNFEKKMQHKKFLPKVDQQQRKLYFVQSWLIKILSNYPFITVSTKILNSFLFNQLHLSTSLLKTFRKNNLILIKL